jgi:DNA-binding response OmpR family regulator
MNGKRILIVEDDSLLSKTLDIFLTQKGHDVKVLNNGADAIKHIVDERPDSILLDLLLPDCNGWFIFKLLNKFDWAKKIPLIIISAMDQDKEKIHDSVKPFAYIQKPFDMGYLMQTLERSFN